MALAQLDTVSSDLVALAIELRTLLPHLPLVTKKAGKLYGNYELSNPKCREITDVADQLVLTALGLPEVWPTVRLADSLFQKATSESGSTKRAWPFDWDWASALEGTV